jgi:hypothetical protein
LIRRGPRFAIAEHRLHAAKTGAHRELRRLPKFLPDLELRDIRELIEAASEGIGLDAIAVRVKKIPRRSLQRRLAALVRAGKLRVDGRGRATRYLRASRVVEAVGAASGQSSAHAVG